MITKVTITDKDNLPLEYASSLDAFANGKEYVFKSGVNIIVGNNGSGKSTLLDMIAMYTMCSGRFKSDIPRIPFIGYILPQVFGFGDKEIHDGIKISSDYAGTVYNFITHTELKDKSLDSAEDVSMLLNGKRMSSGEKQVYHIDIMFQNAFKNTDVQFPIALLREIGKNDYYKEKVDALLNYYKENRDKSIRQEDFEFTFLIDEPDKNMDIHNIDSITAMFSYHKESTQIIAAIHNPIVLYKLRKTGTVNFIELTEGYMDAIDNIMNIL